MSDISKCSNKKCTKKEKCYRWTAPVGHWQSYSNFNFTIKNGRIECGSFWEIEK